MTRTVRAAMTQTVNAYPHMPATLAELPTLRDKLDDIRRANVEHHLALAEIAKREGTQVICFGELFPCPYFAITKEKMWLAMAEPLDGPTVQACAEAAKRHRMVIVAPIYEYDPRADARYNTAVFIDADGEVLGFYSKAHIPHGENEAAQFLERDFYEESTGRPNPHIKNRSRNRYFPVFETEVGRIGCAICYDRHFEGVMRTLKAEGAEIVFSPAATFGEKSRRLWELEFAVDAARHKLFIGGSNRMGQEPPWNQPFYGQSHFVGPNGRLPDLSPHAELVISDLPMNELSEEDPAGWRLLCDRRPQIYNRE